MLSMNRSAFMSGLRRSSARFEKRVAKTLRDVTKALHDNIVEKTPVWSGHAVRNMVWTVGRPNRSAFSAIPDDEGTPGTNAMALGREPRRAENQRAATETLRALRFTRPFTSYHLTNNAPHVWLLEKGMLPDQDSSRSPDGMFLISFHHVVAMLKAGAL